MGLVDLAKPDPFAGDNYNNLASGPGTEQSQGLVLSWPS